MKVASETEPPVFLSFHGVAVRVETQIAGILESLTHDFAFFICDERPCDFVITVERENKRPQDWIAFPRVGRSRLPLAPLGESRVCYFERAWVAG